MSLPTRVDAVSVRHVQVEDDDVWPQLHGFFDHLCAVVDTSNDIEVVRHEQSPNRRAHSWVVFGHQYSLMRSLSDLGCHRHLTSLVPAAVVTDLCPVNIDAHLSSPCDETRCICRCTPPVRAFPKHVKPPTAKAKAAPALGHADGRKSRVLGGSSRAHCRTCEFLSISGENPAVSVVRSRDGARTSRVIVLPGVPPFHLHLSNDLMGRRDIDDWTISPAVEPCAILSAHASMSGHWRLSPACPPRALNKSRPHAGQ